MKNNKLIGLVILCSLLFSIVIVRYSFRMRNDHQDKISYKYSVKENEISETELSWGSFLTFSASPIRNIEKISPLIIEDLRFCDDLDAEDLSRCSNEVCLTK